MAQSKQSTRADAKRNRQKLLEAALKAFTQHGLNTSLEAIAREAGVGIATLYRNFPTRETLALAAYQHEVEQVCEAAVQLSRTLPSDRALREWMSRLTEFVATKQGMSDVLKVVVADSQFYADLDLRGKMIATLATLMRRAAEDGLIRGDVNAEDVMRVMAGIWQNSEGQAEKLQGSRLFDLLLDGLRYGALVQTQQNR